ncbi:vignain [Eucalyptus grandis]|uniref:vignain n=1 Tax=Eucalyptus grandis TaxID=71139 RepID=UPI00192EBB89|nr:vignain [Eucalyptus grandis]
MEERHEQWMAKYGKVYRNAPEKEMRLQIFTDDVEFVDAFNAGGLATEANYPYDGTDGTCKTTKEASHAAKITDYEVVPANDEATLLKAVANRPASASIDAGGRNFQFHSTGILTGDCGTYLGHGVTAAGYGNTADGT